MQCDALTRTQSIPRSQPSWTRSTRRSQVSPSTRSTRSSRSLPCCWRPSAQRSTPEFAAAMDTRVRERFSGAGALDGVRGVAAPSLAQRVTSWLPQVAGLAAGLAAIAVLVIVIGSGGGSSSSFSSSSSAAGSAVRGAATAPPEIHSEAATTASASSSSAVSAGQRRAGERVRGRRPVACADAERPQDDPVRAARTEHVTGSRRRRRAGGVQRDRARERDRAPLERDRHRRQRRLRAVRTERAERGAAGDDGIAVAIAVRACRLAYRRHPGCQRQPTCPCSTA